jgi:hypothetical protein
MEGGEVMLVNNVGLKAYTYVVLVQAKHGESMHACMHACMHRRFTYAIFQSETRKATTSAASKQAKTSQKYRK